MIVKEKTGDKWDPRDEIQPQIKLCMFGSLKVCVFKWAGQSCSICTQGKFGDLVNTEWTTEEQELQ